MISVTARAATASDIDVLTELYGLLEDEMVGLKPIWAATDGLPAPIDAAFRDRLEDDASGVIIGELDDAVVGFLVWRHTDLLPQGGGNRLAAIDLIFTHADARRVGVGEAMAGRFLAEARDAGIALFDAVAPPGHRDAKNFFESHGFKARRIVMHRDEQ